MKRVFFRIPHVALLLALLVGVNLVSGCGGSSVLTIAFTTSSQVLDANLSSRVMTIQVTGRQGQAIQPEGRYHHQSDVKLFRGAV